MLWFRSVIAVAVAAIGLIACSFDDARGGSESRQSVVITAFDADRKIQGIKAIRAETGLGLAHAKRLIEGTPSLVKAGLTRSEANALAARLRGHGMTVEIHGE